MTRLDFRMDRLQLLTVCGIVVVGIVLEILLLQLRSSMPAFFGRYSNGAVLAMVLTLIGTVILGVLSALSHKAARWILISSYSILTAAMIIEVGGRFLAPSLSDDWWYRLPYAVKRASLDARASVAADHRVWDGMFSSYRANHCIEMEGYGDQPTKTVEVCHDGIGFRNPRGTYIAHDTIPIVALGDSFTHGGGVAKPWPELLAETLRKPVLNLGIPGGAPQYWVEALKRYGLAKRPRIVIVATWDSNDFNDASRWSRVQRAGGDFMHYRHVIAPYEGGSLLKRLGNYSVFASLVQSINMRHVWSSGGSNARISVAGLAADLRIGRGVPAFESLVARSDSGLREFTAALREVATLADGIGATMMLVYFSTASAVYAPYIVDASSNVVRDVRNQERLSEWLQRLSQEIGFVYVDTTPPLRKLAALPPVLYDDHFTQAGNAAVSHIVGSALEQEGLWP